MTPKVELLVDELSNILTEISAPGSELLTMLEKACSPEANQESFDKNGLGMGRQIQSALLQKSLLFLIPPKDMVRATNYKSVIAATPSPEFFKSMKFVLEKNDRTEEFSQKFTQMEGRCTLLKYMITDQIAELSQAQWLVICSPRANKVFCSHVFLRAATREAASQTITSLQNELTAIEQAYTDAPPTKKRLLLEIRYNT